MSSPIYVSRNLFECANCLSPAVHNSLILLLSLFLLLWLNSTSRRHYELGRSISILQQHGCLHLRGMNVYAKDFSRLLRTHVAQILRLRRTVPAVVVPRIIIPASSVKKKYRIVHEDETYSLEFSFCSWPNIQTKAKLISSKTPERIFDYVSSCLFPNSTSVSHDTLNDNNTTHPTIIHLNEKIDKNGLTNTEEITTVPCNTEAASALQQETTTSSSSILQTFLHSVSSLHRDSSQCTDETRLATDPLEPLLLTEYRDTTSESSYIELVLAKKNGEIKEELSQRDINNTPTPIQHHNQFQSQNEYTVVADICETVSILPSTSGSEMRCKILINPKMFEVITDETPLDLFLILEPIPQSANNDGQQLKIVPPPEIANEFLGGIPVACSHTEVTHLRITTTPIHVSNNNKQLTDKINTCWTVTALNAVYYSKALSLKASLIPSLYYATFNQYNANSNHPLPENASSSFSSSVNIPTSNTVNVYDYHQQQQQQEQPLSPSWNERHRAPLIQSSSIQHTQRIPFNYRLYTRWRHFIQRLLGNQFSRQNVLQQRQQPESDNLQLLTEPPPIPPTPDQWIKLIKAQENLDVFGFGSGEERDCLICMCRPKEVTLMPCRHSPCCSECLKSLRQEKCPICRGVFSSFVVFPLNRTLET